MNQHVTLTFSLKYLVNFAKSSSLSDDVQLMMSNDVPLLVSVLLFPYAFIQFRRNWHFGSCQVSYKFGQGFIRYYLAPKIGDEWEPTIPMSIIMCTFISFYIAVLSISVINLASSILVYIKWIAVALSFFMFFWYQYYSPARSNIKVFQFLRGIVLIVPRNA